jgi:predicted nuclease of predicted toxin-antitoxin system
MTWRFLVDDDVSWSVTSDLRAAAYDTEDVREIELRAHSDQEVFLYAQKRGAILITADRGFANTFRFPLRDHFGIIVVRIPDEYPTATVMRELFRALHDLDGEELNSTLVIVEPGRLRIRRHVTGF